MIVAKDGTTVQIIFVNTTAKKSGIDHVGLYFKEISITNDDGQIVVLHDVFFSMEGKDNDLTHVPFEEYYKMHKNDIFWGDQLY